MYERVPLRVLHKFVIWNRGYEFRDGKGFERDGRDLFQGYCVGIRLQIKRKYLSVVLSMMDRNQKVYA